MHCLLTQARNRVTFEQGPNLLAPRGRLRREPLKALSISTRSHAAFGVMSSTLIEMLGSIYWL